MSDYPKDLTTSDWVDYCQGKTRDEQISALATFHRRIEHDAQTRLLGNLESADDDEKSIQAVTKAVERAARKLSPPQDHPRDVVGKPNK